MSRSFLWLLAAGVLAGCSAAPNEGGGGASSEAAPVAVALQRPMAMDGRFDDWPAGAVMAADGEHLYFRLRTPEVVTLQAADRTYALQLDLDGDAATGIATDMDEASPALGIDLEVQFSPFIARRGRTPERGQAVRVLAAAPDGRITPVGHAAAGVLFAPTHSSDEFEIRLNRAAQLPALASLDEGATAAAAAPPTVAARFITLDAAGRQVAALPVLRLDLPAMGDDALRQAETIPARAADEIRVVTLNVEYAATVKNPEPFARILRALDPDIVLIQEWDKGDADDIANWFRQHVPPASGWRCLRSAGWGVAIVARHPMRRLGPELLTRPEDAPADTHIPDRAIRFVGALVNTPIGDIAAASVHFKCCGHDGSPEDLARIAEARLINETFAGALATQTNGPTPLRVIGGDLNLVGSRNPLEALAAGLDADGSNLLPLEPWVMGDAAQYTWMDSESPFTPGRLDYLLVADSALEVSRSFILDTALLSDEALAAHGLKRSDSAATDHRPIVTDVRRR